MKPTHEEDAKKTENAEGGAEEPKSESGEGGEKEEESSSQQVPSPPIVVAITGPPKVGKSTLLRSLVKHYVQQSVSHLNGPITIVTGKRKRITFVEVPNQLSEMIDAAKVADYVLLLIDASTGFEMETFEFINILQVHGMPRVMGVLTHLDLVTKAARLRSTKRTLKHRLWTELYKGAKLFHLSRLINTAYPKQEVSNLARFLSVARIQPIPWRALRPYMLCDRIEDLTDPELVRRDPLSTPRELALYGWLRGADLQVPHSPSSATTTMMHLPGVGADFKLAAVRVLDDPCPLPAQQKAKRSLNEREQVVYAPFSGLGGVLYDKDATYIETGGAQAFKQHDNKSDRGEIFDAMEQLQGTIDAKIHDAPLKLLSGSRRAVREEDISAATAASAKKRKRGSDTDADAGFRFTPLAEGEQVTSGDPLAEKEEGSTAMQSYPAGTYVRLLLADIPATFVEHFNPSRIHIVGGVLPEEQVTGYIRVRLKKHRWYERILKSRDPLIISCGWRRYQSMVIYATQDANNRFRFFKYTPAVYCQAIFYGPLASVSNGLLGIQSLDEDETQRGFRIAATGVVLSLDQSVEVMKKLKLIGEPLEVYKKTAFIKGMFNSALEVALFQGAALQTTSGIRGVLKKALREPDGAFRASFEDKIRENDVVFLRTWVKAPLPKFHVPLTDKLLPDGERWLGMKTVGRLRHERQLKPHEKKDSGYHRHLKHERTQELFVPQEMVIPKKLQRQLPYALKPKFAGDALPDDDAWDVRGDGRHRKRRRGDEDREPLVERHSAVVLEPHESRIHRLMDELHTVHEDQREREGRQLDEKWAARGKEVTRVEGLRRKKMMATKKRICRRISKRDTKQLRTTGGAGGALSGANRLSEMTGA